MIVFHLIKNRFGELCMLFFKQDLKYFEVQEGPTPQTNKVHIKNSHHNGKIKYKKSRHTKSKNY